MQNWHDLMRQATLISLNGLPNIFKDEFAARPDLASVHQSMVDRMEGFCNMSDILVIREDMKELSMRLLDEMRKLDKAKVFPAY